MKKNIPVAVALAGALASAALLIASFVSGKAHELLFSLPDSTVRLVPPFSALATIIFVGLCFYFRKKNREDA